ncbi:hypothetical protein C4546_02135 [Candidatus Parcubacteria bacterium]|jgi:uncharacterized protein (TIGR00725 family)|nr:MAG: hypothetical protein C4546_02135 [Candidatus Parcubacteria bacterium]
MSTQIGVIGGSQASLAALGDKADAVLSAAHQIGFLLAKQKIILITGGMDGVMQAACQGAKEGGGITVGTPGRNRKGSNEFVDVEICTPIDVGDFLFAGLLSCDAIIILPGGPGTWAEIYMAYRLGIPMIVYTGFSQEFDRLAGTSFDESQKVVFIGASTAEECISQAVKFLEKV